MTDLARELGKLGAWVRLHYVYPYPHVDQVIPLMAEGLVLPYLDIPFQHASPKVLRAMRARPTRPRCWSASAAGARSAPTSRSAPPSSSASPARPRRISNICSTGSRSAARPRRRLPLRAGRRRRGQCLPDPVPEEVKEERYARVMELTAAHQRRQARGQGRPHARRDHRRGRRRRRRHRPLQGRRAGDRRRSPPARRRRAEAGDIVPSARRGRRRARPLRR
jgi:hypothetical protein